MAASNSFEIDFSPQKEAIPALLNKIQQRSARVFFSITIRIFLVLLVISVLLTTGCSNDSKPSAKLYLISITPENSSVYNGGVQQLEGLGNYDDGSIRDITTAVSWSSDDEAIVTVDGSGLVTSKSVGMATITASLAGLDGTAMIQVGNRPSPPQSSSNVKVLIPSAITNDFEYFSINIPEASESIGIIILGTNTNYKMVDHGVWLKDEFGNRTFFITDPNGDPVPLSFNMIDQGFGEEPYGDNLFNRQAATLFFPNNGSTATLIAGTYTLPVASFNAVGTDLEIDTLQPYVLYKTNTASQQTMNVNIWVAEGLRSSITSQASAQTDPEILGAISVLSNVYQTQAGMNLIINVGIIPSSYLTLETESEQDMLLRSYPVSAASDALNLFVVGQLTYIDGGGSTGVIGISAGIPGPFNMHGTVVSGTLAEYQGDGVGNLLGFTLAHEFGHFLGLWHTSQTDQNQENIIGHDPIADTARCITSDMGATKNIDFCPDRNNLMFPIADDVPDPPITPKQIRVLLLNPAVSTP